MYLHVGNNKNIREKSIIGIFDTDTSTVSTITRKFLSGAEKRALSPMDITGLLWIILPLSIPIRI
jgi:hypothetical protein